MKIAAQRRKRKTPIAHEGTKGGRGLKGGLFFFLFNIEVLACSLSTVPLTTSIPATALFLYFLYPHAYNKKLNNNPALFSSTPIISRNHIPTTHHPRLSLPVQTNYLAPKSNPIPPPSHPYRQKQNHHFQLRVRGGEGGWKGVNKKYQKNKRKTSTK